MSTDSSTSSGFWCTFLTAVQPQLICAAHCANQARTHKITFSLHSVGMGDRAALLKHRQYSEHLRPEQRSRENDSQQGPARLESLLAWGTHEHFCRLSRHYFTKVTRSVRFESCRRNSASTCSTDTRLDSLGDLQLNRKILDCVGDYQTVVNGYPNPYQRYRFLDSVTCMCLLVQEPAGTCARPPVMD
jgi:hypothetical protein